MFQFLILLSLACLVSSQTIYQLFDTQMQFVTMNYDGSYMVFFDDVSNMAYSTTDFGKTMSVIPGSMGMKYGQYGNLPEGDNVVIGGLFGIIRVSFSIDLLYPTDPIVSFASSSLIRYSVCSYGLDYLSQFGAETCILYDDGYALLSDLNIVHVGDNYRTDVIPFTSGSSFVFIPCTASWSEVGRGLYSYVVDVNGILFRTTLEFTPNMPCGNVRMLPQWIPMNITLLTNKNALSSNSISDIVTGLSNDTAYIFINGIPQSVPLPASSLLQMAIFH